MSVILTPAADGNGKIGYENLFTKTGVTVTYSDQVTGYEAANAYDWKQYDWWKQSALGTSWIRASFASAQAADYMCVFGHNLHSVGGSIKPQYSTNGGSTWNDATTATSPVNGNTQFIQFSSVLAADWRALVTTTTGQSIIAGIMIGSALNFERDLTAGFVPPTLSPNIEAKTAMSEGGVNLGTSNIRTGVSGTISLSNLSVSWVFTYWRDLIDHLNNGYPCVFMWDSVNYSDEPTLIWKRREMGKPSYASPNYMSATFEYEGIL